MKLIYVGLMTLALSACGNPSGTTSEMAGRGSNASDLTRTDSNGMGVGTVSGTTQSKSSTSTPGADDPATHSNDSANPAEAKPATAAKKKTTTTESSKAGTSDNITNEQHK